MNDDKKQFLSELELETLLPTWMHGVEEFKFRFRSLDLSRSALLIIDMQNEFLLNDGILPTWGGPAVIPRLKRLIDLYRKLERPVIFTQHCYYNPEIDGGTTAEWWRMDRNSPVLKVGLPGTEIHTDLSPLSTDIVIKKHRYNAFHDTNLESILRRFDVRDVIIGGVSSNCCCEATAHEALFRDFHIFVLADGCGGSDEMSHAAFLRDIALYYGTILTCEELMRQLGKD